MKTTKNKIKNGCLFQTILTEFSGSESVKTNVLLNLTKEQVCDSFIGKIYLYAKDLSEPKYEFLIK